MKYTGERMIPKEDAEAVHPSFQHKMEAEHFVRYKFASSFIEDKRVLDLGCGTGYGSDFLIKKYKPKGINAIDISAQAIEYANKNFIDNNLSFLIASAEKIPFENESFDIVICYELIEHVNNYLIVFDEIRRVLKEDGILIISTPRRKEKLRNEFHTYEFKEEEFKNVLKKYFGDNVKLYVQNNIFASVISDGNNIDTFDSVFSLDEFKFDNSDYFIAICGNIDLKKINKAEIVVENDEYIVNLEDDVAILHKAEGNYIERIRNTDEIVISHSQWVKNLQQENIELKDLLNKLKK
jgi:O-antigen biosynthesis protein